MMKWKRMSKTVMMMILMVTMAFGMKTNIFAQTISDADAVKKEETEKQEVTEEQSFTNPGNAQLQDDFGNSTQKEFFTFTTKNHTTFYVVIDRSTKTDNVHVLTQIDENDLADLLENEIVINEDPVISVMPDNILEEVEPSGIEEKKETEVLEESKKEEPRDLSKQAGLVLFIAFAGCAAGAAYYVKVYKGKREYDDSADEGIEVSDGSGTSNADEK